MEWMLILFLVLLCPFPVSSYCSSPFRLFPFPTLLCFSPLKQAERFWEAM